MINYSFIIPHHNTPDLLRRLIDSIPQREDIEIIVVDDNSDENKKASILRADVRTISIDKNHTRWAGHARNVGIEASVGKWLLFADSDDFYKNGFLNVLDEYKDDNFDILFYNVESVDSITLKPANRANFQRKLIERYDGSPSTTNNLLYRTNAPWMRMFNSAYIKRYNFRYEEIVRTNDILFSLLTSYFVRNFKVDKRSVYVCTYNKDSLTASRITMFKFKAKLFTFIRRAELFYFVSKNDNNFVYSKWEKFKVPYRIIYGVFKRQPITGIWALLYYISHWFVIKKESGLYVEIVKEIDNKNK